MKILELRSYVNNKSRKNLWISDQIFGFAENSLCLMYLLTEFGRSVRENLAQGKRLIVIFRYSRPCYLSICLVPLDVLYRFCDSTRDVRLIMPICKNLIVQLPRQRPANGLMWFRDVNTKGIRGHVRPFWTEIYYMGVVKNRELKWSFVGALTLSNPIYERGYVLISHRASSPGSPPIWILPSPSSYMVWYPRFKIKMKWMGGQ